MTPTINVSLSVIKLEIYEKETGTVDCFATGDPVVLGYTWSYQGVEIAATDGRFKIAAGGSPMSSLTITSASLSMDESVVLCEARNRIDTESVYAVVRIIGRCNSRLEAFGPAKDNKFKHEIEVLILSHFEITLF